MKRLLEQELAGCPAPPLGDLVTTAVRKGHRQRQVRRMLAAASGVAAAAFATVAVLLTPAVLGAITTGPGDDVVAPAAAPAATGEAPLPTVTVPVPTQAPTTDAPVTVDPSPRPRCGGNDPVTLSASLSPRTHVTNCPAAESLDFDVVTPKLDGQIAPLTARDALKLLLGLLPKGRTSDYTISDEPWTASGLSTMALQLDRGDGPGMIRLTISHADPATAARCEAGQLCYSLPDGITVVIYDLPDDCLTGRGLWVQRPDGIRVELNIARCLPWDGRTNRPTEPVLTTQEALTIALDPRWGGGSTARPQSLTAS